MSRWFLLAMAIVANAVSVFVALVPGIITYAELPSDVVTCNICSLPEFQTALTRAAAIGRAQVAGFIQSNTWVLVASAVVNISIVGALIYMLRSKRTDPM